MIERRIITELTRALDEEPADDPDRKFTESLLASAQLYLDKPELFQKVTLTERERRAIELGKKLSVYFGKFSPDSSLIDIIPHSSGSVVDDDWRTLMGTFTNPERRNITQTLNALGNFSKRNPGKIGTIRDIEKFDFGQGWVVGVGRISELTIREAFRRPDLGETSGE